MILFYTENITSRLEYIVDFVFKAVLQVDFLITTDVRLIAKHNDVVINYSSNNVIKGIQILPSSLLFETNIKEIKEDVFEWEGVKVFFKTNLDSKIPFDLFSAGFYLLSRYEEYLINSKDKYDRFIAEDSIAFQYGFHSIPIVDIWILKLKQIILDEYPQSDIPIRKFNFIPTIDIDNAWAYKHKGKFRTFGGIVRSILKVEIGDLLKRIGVLVFRKKDPYDNYSYIESLHKKNNLDPVYFFLLRNNGKYDTSHDVNNKNFKKLINDISKKSHVGIHPSFTSNSNASLIKEETAILSNFVHRKIIKSRNHFLRIRFPHTFNALVKIGIEQDYSIGYSSQSGFRSGTCTIHKFYNVKRNKILDLEIIPFQVMDATLKYYLKLKPIEAINHIKSIVKEVVKVDGTFVSIWHNESLSNRGKWKNWRPVYEELIAECNKFL